jgi:CHASE2 domain-containing sensor protein
MSGVGLPRWKTIVQGLVIFVVALIFSVLIGESVVGNLLAQWTLDRFIRWDPPRDEDQIVLIDITEEDYSTMFGRRRPLDPAIVVELLGAAHRAGAKLIAVDINTADWPQGSEKLLRSEVLSGAAVVWARGFYLDRQSGKPHRRLDRLLGDVTTPNPECYGVPALDQGSGIVRYFYSGLKFEMWEPSFTDQIAYRSGNGSCLLPQEREEELRIIDFSARIRTESASTLLEQSRQKGWGRRPEYADKLLILGGSFHSGADASLTPVGEMSGLEIAGQALSSFMRKKARKELGKISSLLIDAGVGFLLLVVGLWSRRGQLVLAIVIVVLGGVPCLYLFRQYYLFVGFVPFVLGSGVHLLLGWVYERA